MNDLEAWVAYGFLLFFVIAGVAVAVRLALLLWSDRADWDR
jgi:hypothetical protein